MDLEDRSLPALSIRQRSALRRARMRELTSPEARWADRDEQRAPSGLFATGGFTGARSRSSIEVKSVGPTEADQTFFQSIRMRLANNPLDKVFAQHPIVYAAVHAKSSNLSETPFKIRPSARPKAAPVENQLSHLFDDPNPLMSEADFRYMIGVYLEISGECIVVKEGRDGRVRHRSEVPAELWPLNGKLFKHVVDPATKLVKWWVINAGSPQEVAYADHEVVHLRYPNPYDPYRGLAPLEAARLTIQTDWNALRYNEAFFENSGDPGGIITIDRPLGDQQRQEIEQRIEDRHRGVDKQKRVMVLGNGAKYESLSQSHRDMEFADLRKSNRVDILAVFRVPPAEAGFYEDVNNATAKEESRRFWTRTMFPIFRIVEDGFWGELFRWVFDQKYIGKFDRDAIPELQRDILDQIDGVTKLVAAGWTAEQAAAKVGLEMPVNDWQRRAWTTNPNMVDFATLDAAMSASEESEAPATPSSFNEAQVSSAREILVAVGKGEMGPEAAYQMLVQFFPGIDPASARIMVDEARTTTGLPMGSQGLPALPPGSASQAPGPAAQDPIAPDIAGTAGMDALETAAFQRRRLYWKKLHDTHYGAEEPKFRGMVKRVFAEMRAEQLRKVDSLPKSVAAGKVALLLTQKEIEQIKRWSATRCSAEALLQRAKDAEDERSVYALKRHLAAMRRKTPESLDRMVVDATKWREKLGEAARPHYKRVVLATQKRLAQEIGAAIDWDPDSRLVQNLTESLASRVTGVADTVRARLRESLGDVIADGGGVREAQDAVRHVFKVSLARSLTIARTEVGAASNRAGFIALGEAGVSKIQWVSAGDELVRPSHRIDGESIEIGDEFSNGLHHPHDPEGDADEVINCRCDLAPVLDDWDPDDPDAGSLDTEEVEVEERHSRSGVRRR